jgi:hypothetical protein
MIVVATLTINTHPSNCSVATRSILPGAGGAPVTQHGTQFRQHYCCDSFNIAKGGRRTRHTTFRQHNWRSGTRQWIDHLYNPLDRDRSYASNPTPPSHIYPTDVSIWDPHSVDHLTPAHSTPLATFCLELSHPSYLPDASKM